MSGFDRYLDAFEGWPDKDAYEKWVERRRRREQAARIGASNRDLEGRGFALAYERPLTEAPRG